VVGVKFTRPVLSADEGGKKEKTQEIGTKLEKEKKKGTVEKGTSSYIHKTGAVGGYLMIQEKQRGEKKNFSENRLAEKKGKRGKSQCKGTRGKKKRKKLKVSKVRCVTRVQ